MPNPLVSQGVLNRVRGSITFPTLPQLNITAPFLGEEGINMSPEGEISDTISTMTGTVPSQAPYQLMSIEVQLLKSQTFADVWKQRVEFDSFLGNCVVRSDSSTLSNYQIYNASIVQQGPGRLNGKNVGLMVSIRGYWLVNSVLFSGA